KPELAQSIGEASRLYELVKTAENVAARAVGRRFQHEAAKHVGKRFEPAPICLQPFGVARGEFCDFVFRAAGGKLQEAAILERQKVVDPARHDLEAMPRYVEVVDYFRIEQRDRVRGDGIAKERKELFRDSCAAYLVAAFQHQCLQAGGSEIEGADESIVAAADDCRIIGCLSHKVSVRS